MTSTRCHWRCLRWSLKLKEVSHSNGLISYLLSPAGAPRLLTVGATWQRLTLHSSSSLSWHNPHLLHRRMACRGWQTLGMQTGMSACCNISVGCKRPDKDKWFSPKMGCTRHKDWKRNLWWCCVTPVVQEVVLQDLRRNINYFLND